MLEIRQVAVKDKQMDNKENVVIFAGQNEAKNTLYKNQANSALASTEVVKTLCRNLSKPQVDPYRETVKKGHKIVFMFLTKTDHDGTRTHNLPIRSRTPYPLGHAALPL